MSSASSGLRTSQYGSSLHVPGKPRTLDVDHEISQCSVKSSLLAPLSVNSKLASTGCSAMLEQSEDPKPELGCEAHTACSNHSVILDVHYEQGGCNSSKAASTAGDASATQG
ncbi:hypothetical protein IAT40_005475 [Kwoniella sp. CBS 6097]